MAERFEEKSFDRCDAVPQSFAHYELDVFLEVHMDDLHGTGPRIALEVVQNKSSQKIRFKIWTVCEVCMKYEYLERERVLHNGKTEITPNPKYLRVVFHNMGLTNCKPAPTPSVAGPVKHKLDDDVDLGMQECELHRGIFGKACSTCQLIAVMCDSRKMHVRKR